MRSRIKLEKDFEALVKQIKSSTPAEVGEAPHVRHERVQRLLANWPEFLKYYFPSWAKSDFAPFHIRGGNSVMNWREKKLFFAWAVARNLSKTTFWQMFAMYLNVRAITLRNTNTPNPAKWSNLTTGVFMSKTYDQAAKQLTAMRLQFEYNERLKNDFGVFKTVSTWSDEFFKTSQGISWIPLGKGQSPRGLKDEDLRVNFQIWDDFDDDEECLNENRLEKTWDWITGALIPTLDVSDEALVVILNNIIHPRSLMSRVLGKVQDVDPITDWSETVNLMNDARTEPTWKARHSLKDCQYMITKTGKLKAEAEYFNNPVISGKVFNKDWIRYKPMKDLRSYTALVAYLDPSFSAKKNADHKSLVLMGVKDGEFHVLKTFCGVATIEEMVEWCYIIEEYVKKHHGAFELWMEDVFFQSILYKDFAAAARRKGWPLPVQGDTRQKPDKDQRIMALSGHFERSEWYFNEAEKDNHHMQTLIFQFTSFAPGHTGIKKDGPDACEGAKEKLIARIQTLAPPTYGKRAKPKATW
jgi:hypothetical protein